MQGNEASYGVAIITDGFRVRGTSPELLMKEKALDLAHRNPSRVYRNDLLSEAFKALLPFGDQLGLKALRRPQQPSSLLQPLRWFSTSSGALPLA